MFKIGRLEVKSNVLLAPMDGVNCRAFRQLCLDSGAGLVATPMIVADRLLEDKKRVFSAVEFSRDEHPLMVQLVGNESEKMKKATLMVEEYADVVDVNLGCCEKDILGMKAGCFFIKHPEQLKKIIPPVMDSTNKPVTAKIRTGWDAGSVNTAEVCKALEDFGVSAITVHARRRDQDYNVKADWEQIRKAKQTVNIPVIGNGDVSLPGHAKAMLERTGCDAVMIGRAARGNPLLFRQIVHLLEKGKNMPEPSAMDRVNSFLKFASYYQEQRRKSLSEFKAHASWFASGLKNADFLRKKIGRADSFRSVEMAFSGAFTSSSDVPARPSGSRPSASGGPSSWRDSYRRQRDRPTWRSRSSRR